MNDFFFYPRIINLEIYVDYTIGNINIKPADDVSNEYLVNNTQIISEIEQTYREFIGQFMSNESVFAMRSKIISLFYSKEIECKVNIFENKMHSVPTGWRQIK